MLIDYKTRFKGKDLNFNLNLSNKNELGGLSDGIESFIEEQTGLSINPASDGEKLKYVCSTNAGYQFLFYNTGSTTYGTTLLNAGFNQSEIDSFSDSIKKSFYLFQVYNSTISNSQTLLHSGYYNGFTFSNGPTEYNISSESEISGYYLSNDQQSQIISNTVYLKLSFYNSKTGRLQLFQNDAKSSITTEDKLYFNITLNPSNMTYSFSSPLIAREFINYAYVNKLNENVPTFTYEAPTYPTGGTSLSGNTYFNS